MVAEQTELHWSPSHLLALVCLFLWKCHLIQAIFRIYQATLEQSSSSDDDKHVNSAHAKRCKFTTPSVTKGKEQEKAITRNFKLNSTSLKDKVTEKQEN